MCRLVVTSFNCQLCEQSQRNRAEVVMVLRRHFDAAPIVGFGCDGIALDYRHFAQVVECHIRRPEKWPVRSAGMQLDAFFERALRAGDVAVLDKHLSEMVERHYEQISLSQTPGKRHGFLEKWSGAAWFAAAAKEETG